MKLSYSSLLTFILVGTAVAIPNRLEQREVKNDPIDLGHLFGDKETKECGGKHFSGEQIHSSIQHAVNLVIAGETRGKNQYPHSFPYNDSKGVALKFPSYCPADSNRREYPLKEKVYNGGPKNNNPGATRVIYYWKKDDKKNGKPNVMYCGLITHTGAQVKNGFVQC